MGMYPHKYEWASVNQQNNDCSIWIRAAQLEFDDGSWECQVTASDFHTQDALTSRPVRLVVRGEFFHPHHETFRVRSFLSLDNFSLKFLCAHL